VIRRNRLVHLIALAFLIAIVWAFLGVFFASQEHAMAEAHRDTETLRDRTRHSETACAVWALLTPLVIYAADRLPLRAPSRNRNVALLLAIGVVVVFLRSLFDAYMPGVLDHEPLAPRQFRDTVMAVFHLHFLFYLTIVGLTNFVRVRLEADQRARREAQIDAELVRAQVQRLRGDLQPHFLFNTLHAVTTLVHTDSRAAQETIAKLIELLRSSMSVGARAEVPLSEELDFVGRYLDLHKVRFGDRLRSRIDVADPGLLRACVPPLLLQPLVENSIIHGIRKRSGGGAIAVRVFREDELLRLQVRDSGPGCDPEAPFSRSSIGVPNTRARLEYLYHDARALSFRRDGDEFVADIRIPLRFP
jgi:hypothetical protein